MRTKVPILFTITIVLFAGLDALAQKRPKPQRVTVNLYAEGYRPESFRLRRGVPAKITFIRRAEGCGDVIVISEYGIRRSLPMNRPVVIMIRPKRSGTFKFACGMDMYRGQIIVS